MRFFWDGRGEEPPESNVYDGAKSFCITLLAFLRDEDGHISPFAVLGLKNKEIEAEIEKLELELGSVEEKTGLRHSYQEHKDAHTAKSKLAKEASEKLDKLISEKANKSPKGIKHNPFYKDSNYDIRKIKADIYTVQNKRIIPFDDTERTARISLLGETALPDIHRRLTFSPTITTLATTANELITRKIQPSAPIQELLNDATLQNWVKSGVALHQHARASCAFCGNTLSADLWKKLGDHFNQESQDLENAINSAQVNLATEVNRVVNFSNVSRQSFYSLNQSKFDSLNIQLHKALDAYAQGLATLEGELQARRGDIFFERHTVLIQEDGAKVLETIAAINDLIDHNNKTTSSLSEQQTNARKELRLSEVAQFIVDIGLVDEMARIQTLQSDVDKAKKDMDRVAVEGTKRRDRIKTLKAQLRDEKRGAEQVNHYLSHFLGHCGLRLAAVEETDTAIYRFQVLRGDQAAYHLSEGECSLVAFCYFLAKLDDVDTKGKKLIIYIDDPISSLDSNHIFFVFSLIENYLARPVTNEDGLQLLDSDNKPTYRYEQLFISTHNLEFLKYLKRLTKPAKDNDCFLITKKEDSSVIGLMPTYLRNYVTELNYLFGEIYYCTEYSNANKHYHSFYNFGNNLRKFLEAFLFFKYPFHKNDNDYRVKQFFSDGTNSEALVQRLINEFSHLGEFIDRGTQPIDCAEIATVAKFVLKKIRDNDQEQFNHFLLSIEKSDPFLPA